MHSYSEMLKAAVTASVEYQVQPLLQVPSGTHAPDLQVCLQVYQSTGGSCPQPGTVLHSSTSAGQHTTGPPLRQNPHSNNAPTRVACPILEHITSPHQLFWVHGELSLLHRHNGLLIAQVHACQGGAIAPLCSPVPGQNCPDCLPRDVSGCLFCPAAFLGLAAALFQHMAPCNDGCGAHGMHVQPAILPTWLTALPT